MRGQPIRIAGRILAAAVVGSVALLAAASPGHAATSTAAQAAAAWHASRSGLDGTLLNSVTGQPEQ